MTIPTGKGRPKHADERTLNIIRGKAMVGHHTHEDVWTLLDHIQFLETQDANRPRCHCGVSFDTLDELVRHVGDKGHLRL